MQKLLLVFAALCLVAAPGFALSLYEQEGTTADGPSSINAAGQGPANANFTNWKYQYGGGSWSGIYAGADGWYEESSSGDSTLEVEADIEMYYTETISNNKIYFHIGNPFTATNADKTAYVTGSFASNNGQYIGISFAGQSKDINSFEKVGGSFTGVIFDAMQSDNDTWRAQDNSFDLQILLNTGSGWQPPVNYGDGAHNTVHDTLWWIVGGGAPGSYNFTWQVKLLCDPYQPDGDYYLDPTFVAAPAL